MAEKVTYKELRNATVHVDNSVDTAKVYDIAADVRIGSNSSIEAIDSGTVQKTGAQVATFNMWGGSPDNLNIQFTGVEQSEQCDVLEAVNAFIADVKTKVSGMSLASLIN